jgi:fimbrial chaperone protein
MVLRGSVALVAAVALLCLASFARAATFGLSPMRVELSPAAPTAVVQVSNAGDAPVTIQVQQRTWRQVDGKDLNEDTRALVVNPPIFTIKPLGRQVVRIALRAPPAGRVEQAYRMIFAEVPASRAEHGPGFAFQIALRLDIPVFVAPITGKATPKATWSIVGDDIAKRLRIGNEGNGNLRLTELKVTQGERTLAEPGAIVVLPGAFRLVELSGKLADDPLHVRALQGLGNGEAVDFTLPPALH